MQKLRTLRYHRYRVPWYDKVNWNVAIEWGCWFVLVCVIIAISMVMLFGSF